MEVFSYLKSVDYQKKTEEKMSDDMQISNKNDENTPERRMIDHDNCEINAVTDIVALYLLPDDSPKFCNLYYTTYRFEYDATQVFIVPKEDLARWMKKYESGT